MRVQKHLENVNSSNDGDQQDRLGCAIIDFWYLMNPDQANSIDLHQMRSLRQF